MAIVEKKSIIMTGFVMDTMIPADLRIFGEKRVGREFERDSICIWGIYIFVMKLLYHNFYHWILTLFV